MTDSVQMADLAPNFHCEACGASVGAQRELGGPWSPGPCWRCEQKRLAKGAAARRKLGDVAAGVDVRRAFEAYRKMPPFAGNLGRHIKLTVGHRAEARWSGHAATYRRAIRVAYGPHATKAEVLEILVHEMCHLACPPQTGHGERFRLTLRRAARELWGIEVELLRSSQRGEKHNAAYAMDRIIMIELEKLIRACAVDTFDHVPAPAVKPSRAEISTKLIERRAAHAVKMLTRAEKRAKAMQRVLTKWRTKVRYYERVAAKRSSP